MPNPQTFNTAAPREPAPPGRSAAWTLFVLLWIAAYGTSLAFTLNRRFDRRYDFDSAMWSVAARNLLHNGFIAMHGGVYLSAGDFPRAQHAFYAGHPPLLPWILAGWMRLFGQSHVAIRALPLAATLVNLCLLHLLARRLLGNVGGALAVVIGSLMPMTAFYSQSVNMEPFCATAMLGAGIAYLSYCQGKSWAMGAVCACVALGCWMDWPVFLFAAILGLCHVLRRSGSLSPVPGGEGGGEGPAVKAGRSRVSASDPSPLPSPLGTGERGRPPLYWSLRLPLALAAVLCVMFGLFLLYLHANGASFRETAGRLDVGAAFNAHSREVLAANRSHANDIEQMASETGYKTLFRKFTHRKELREWIVVPFTLPAILLAAAGGFLCPFWSRRLILSDVRRAVFFRLLVALIGMQVVYSLVFADKAGVHEYWQYFLTLPIALLGAALCAWLAEKRQCRARCLLVARLGVVLILLWLPRAAWWPFAYRMKPWHDQPLPPGAIDRSMIAVAPAFDEYTTPRDVILTRSFAVGPLLPWYADRFVLGQEPLLTTGEIIEWIGKRPGRRALYWWTDEVPPELFSELSARFPVYQAGPLKFVLLRGEPDARWKRVSP